MIEQIENLILNDFKLSSSGGCYEFKEAKSDKCKSIKIFTSGKSLALNLDRDDKKVLNFFDNTNKSLTSMNDGAIILNKRDKLIILLVELKSNNSGNYLNQLKSGQNFVKYILNQIQLSTRLCINDVIYRGILFKTGRVTASKNTTKRTPLKYEDRSGLMCLELPCNQEYRLVQFIEDL